MRRYVTFRDLADTNRGAVLDQRAKILDADGSQERIKESKHIETYQQMQM